MKKINHNLVIQNNPEEFYLDDAVIATIDLQEGFVYSMSNSKMPFLKLADLLEEIVKETGELTKYKYAKSKTAVQEKYKNDKIRIYVSGDVKEILISFYCISEEILNKVWDKFIEANPSEDDTELYFHSYFIQGNKVSENSKIMGEKDVKEISKMYYPYIDTDIMFEQFCTGKENILLIVGEPGLGKSKLSSLALKYAFNNIDKLPYDKVECGDSLDNQYISVGYVKNTEVLADDQFWRMAQDMRHDFIVLDDLDYMLTKRDAEVTSSDDKIKNNFLNQFLSFTDGLENNKTKFIITTNQTYDSIDAALLRKGRLFDILELRRLDRVEALAIWTDNNLDVNEFNELFTSHEILSADLGSEISKRLNKRIKNQLRSYLKEDGISKTKKATRVKKIGL